MKIKLKIFVITILILIFSFSYVYAIDMFLNNNITNIDSSETILENIIESEELSEINPDNLTSASNPAPTVTHTSSATNSALSVSDIIDIILIAVCIVLIFLGVAILIRCK